MKKGYLFVILFIYGLLFGSAFAAQDPEETLKAIVKVRSIIPNDARTANALGTEREGHGVVIDSNGLVLTIGYLILEAKTIEITGTDGLPVPAEFVGYDHSTGFGILRAQKPLSVRPMELGKSSELKEGDPILVAGHGGSDAVQGARVVSRKEFAGYWEYLVENAIYTTPPYSNFGGAALIGRDGRLLGIGSIYTQLMLPALGSIPCNMFVPIDLLKPILADLVATGRSHEPSKPWMGFHAEETHGRVFVLRVTPGGPAEKADLRPGDIVLTVNQQEVTGLADFYRKVWALGEAGIEVPLGVLQGTRVTDIRIHSADRFQFLQLAPRP